MSLPQKSQNFLPEETGIGPDTARLTELRSVPRLTAIDGTVDPTSVTVPLSPKRASNRAFELLSQASTALPALMARCQQLETEIAVVRDKAQKEVESTQNLVRWWQGVAEEVKGQNEILQRDLEAMTRRAEAAETDTETAQDFAEKTRQQVAEAECLTALFQEHVMSALGEGTPAHAVLAALRRQG